jgi:hypothetical protein
MQPRNVLFSLVGAVALAAVVVPSVAAQSGANGLRPSVMPQQNLAIAIRPTNGTSHGEHVTLLHFAVEPGLPVHVTFTNYTGKFHTFTAPGLGVSALIRPAHGATPTRTTVTFTAHEHGAFSWACLLCPGEQAGNGAAMRGKIYAIMQV